MKSLAFFIRSVRQDSRLVSHHLMRAALAALILYLFAMQWGSAARTVGGGGRFASMVMLCCYWFLTLLGGVHFSTAIVEEKEEQTLPLLKMTGASAFAILTGKSFPRLAVAILFVCAATPFLILSLSLGGLLPMGLVGAVLSIACYAVMLSQVGLLVSVVCRTASSAFLAMCVMWTAIELCHWYAGLLGPLCGVDRRWSIAMSQYPLITNLSGTLLAFDPTDLWFPHMTYHLTIAVVAFLLSWILFEPFTEAGNTSGEEASTRGVRQSTSRVWTDAVAWKSWRLTTGGWPWIWIRGIGGAMACMVIAVILMVTFDGGFNFDVLVGFATWIGIFFLAINMARLGGQVFNREIHEKTLSSLAMLPQPMSRTALSLSLGLLPAFAAAAAAAGAGACYWSLYLLAESPGFGDFFGMMFFFAWLAHFFTWVLLTLHVGAWISTHIRYGGMLIAVALLWLAGPMLFCGIMFGLMSAIGSDSEIFMLGFIVFLMVLELVICVAVQRLIVQRLELLAGQ